MYKAEESYLLTTMSSPNYEYTFLPQVFHYGETPTDETMQQIQRTTIHMANIIHAASYFQGSMVADTEEEEATERAAVFRQTVQIFQRDNQAGDSTPNVLDSPPWPVQGLMLMDGCATKQNILQGMVLVNENGVPTNTLSLLTVVSDSEPLFITNPNILMPPRASTPYLVYPGPPPPTYKEDEEHRGNYCPCLPTPDIIPQPGVIPRDEWIRNVQGLEPLVNHTIPGMAGREITAPFFHYDFAPDYPEIILSRG